MGSTAVNCSMAAHHVSLKKSFQPCCRNEKHDVLDTESKKERKEKSNESDDSNEASSLPTFQFPEAEAGIGTEAATETFKCSM